MLCRISVHSECGSGSEDEEEQSFFNSKKDRTVEEGWSDLSGACDRLKEKGAVEESSTGTAVSDNELGPLWSHDPLGAIGCVCTE